MKTLQEKFARMDELAKDLERSVAIQSLWPGVGKTTGWWTRYQKKLTFHLRCVATNEERTFDRSQVPSCLHNTKADEEALELIFNRLERAKFKEGKI